jgi:drug/metabolite transporter (DMT)-like permease
MSGRPIDRSDLSLYGLVLVGWGASWIAIPAQLGVVAPEVSVFYRFALSAAIMFAWMLASGRPMRFPWRTHLRFAALGVLTFSSNFAVFYYAGFGIVSGLLAVVFATATVWNLLFSRLIFGDPISGRAVLAAAIGLLGLVLVFSPELARQRFDLTAGLSLLAALTGTAFFSLGNMVSRANQGRGLPVLPANAWGMLYGALWLLLVIAVLGRPLVWDPRPLYAGALMFHVLASTILAFAAYMTLLGRIGAQRAGYATVMFPVIALVISAVFEGYRFTPLAGLGVALVLTGNLLVLTGPAPAEKRA